MPNIAIGLVHWPVLDKAGTTVCTNITHLDIHDIARISTVYAIKKYFLINRMEEQLMYVHRILEHWRLGTGAKYNPMRRTSLIMIETSKELEEAIQRFNPKSKVIVTSARETGDIEKQISFRNLREEIQNNEDQSYFIVFGTGYGLTDEIIERSDLVLEPIKGIEPEDYRHMSVRSAVSICLDRLIGTW